jgi:hypothetical protein
MDTMELMEENGVNTIIADPSKKRILQSQGRNQCIKKNKYKEKCL